MKEKLKRAIINRREEDGEDIPKDNIQRHEDEDDYKTR